MYQTIRFKLLASFGLMLALMLALGVFARIQMGSLHQEATLLGRDNIPSIELANKIDAAILQYRSLQLEHIAATDAKRMAKIEASAQATEQQVARYMKEYEPLAALDEERAALGRLRVVWPRFVARARNEIFAPSRDNQNERALAGFDEAAADYQQSFDIGKTLVLFNEREAAVNVEEADKTYGGSQLLMDGTTLLTLIAGAVLALLISSAIARNARLLEEGTAAVAAGKLDHRVIVRSRDELGRLAGAFNRMVADLRSQRDAIEQRNAELQESFARQSMLLDTVKQLSAPILPLAEGVVVLPLVGHVDTQRAQSIMETLLRGVAEEHARVAILDITGVSAVDTHVLGLLMRAMRAVELLGAQAMLAGVSGEVAQVMVAQGIDLGELRSFRDLREAIRAALEHTSAARVVAAPQR